MPYICGPTFTSIERANYFSNNNFDVKLIVSYLSEKDQNILFRKYLYQHINKNINIDFYDGFLYKSTIFTFNNIFSKCNNNDIILLEEP